MTAANLNPRGMVGRIFAMNHNALLHTKYRSCGLHGFTQNIKVIPHYKSMEAPRHGQFGPQGLGWDDLCREPLDFTIY